MDKKKLAEIAKRLAGQIKDSVVHSRKGEYDISLTGDRMTPSMVVLAKSSSKANDMEKEFQTWNDECLLTAVLTKKKDQSTTEAIKVLKMYNQRKEFFRNQTELAKAMATGTSGQGAEWIPSDFSNQLIEKIQLELKVAAIHTRITMPTDTFNLPAKSSFSQAKLKAENVAGTQSFVGTRKAILDAITLIVDVPFSYEMDEDSAVALLPILTDDIVNALVRAKEDAAINGDTAGTHMDSDVTDAEDPRKAWNGYRKTCLTVAKLDMATFNYDQIVALKKKMGIFGVNPKLNTWIVGTSVYSKLLTLRDTKDNNVIITLDKVGPSAAIISGSVGMVLGSNVIVSEFIREDLNANGVYDATDGGKTIMICVRNDAYLYGDRRKLLVEQDVDISKQQRKIVSSVREAFIDRLDAANNTIVAIGRNITS